MQENNHPSLNWQGDASRERGRLSILYTLEGNANGYMNKDIPLLAAADTIDMEGTETGESAGKHPEAERERERERERGVFNTIINTLVDTTHEKMDLGYTITNTPHTINLLQYADDTCIIAKNPAIHMPAYSYSCGTVAAMGRNEGQSPQMTLPSNPKLDWETSRPMSHSVQPINSIHRP